MSSVVEEQPNGSLTAKEGQSGAEPVAFRELPVDVGDDQLKPADNGEHSAAAGMRGWMSKLGGHRVKVWRRRFFSYDAASGRLQYTKDDSEKGPVLGVISMPHVLYTTLRTDAAQGGGGGMWPTGVPSKRCMQIVTPERTFCLYCDSAAETQRWLVALRGAAGASYGGIEIEITSVERPPSDASLASTSLQLTDAVKIRGTPDSQSTAAAAAALMENEHIVRQYNLANVSGAARSNIIRWHPLKEKALKELNSAYGLDDADHAEQRFSVECDLGRMYAETAPALRARLGEYVLGDYTDELCHNLRLLARHPMGASSVLELIPKRRVLVEARGFPENCSDSSTSSLDQQGITVTLNPRLVGSEAHRVAMDTVEALRVTSSAQEQHNSAAAAAAATTRRGSPASRRRAGAASEHPAAVGCTDTLTSQHSDVTCSDDTATAAVSTTSSEKSDAEEQSQSSVAEEEEECTAETGPDRETPLAGVGSWTGSLTGVRLVVAMGALDTAPQLEKATRNLRRWAAPLRDIALTVQWRELDDVISGLDRDARNASTLHQTFGRSLMGVVLPTVFGRLAAQCRESTEHRAALTRNAPRGVLAVHVRAPRKAPGAGKRLLQLKAKRESEAWVLVVTLHPARFAGLSGAQLREEAGKCKVCKWLEKLN